MDPALSGLVPCLASRRSRGSQSCPAGGPLWWTGWSTWHDGGGSSQLTAHSSDNSSWIKSDVFKWQCMFAILLSPLDLLWRRRASVVSVATRTAKRTLLFSFNISALAADLRPVVGQLHPGWQSNDYYMAVSLLMTPLVTGLLTSPPQAWGQVTSRGGFFNCESNSRTI